MDGSLGPSPLVTGPSAALSAERQGPSKLQAGGICILMAIIAGLAAWDATTLGQIARAAFGAGFVFVVSARLLAALLSTTSRGTRVALPASRLPHYTVVVALKDEAAVAEQLCAHLAALDYPASKLTGLLVVEADDPDTRDALETANRPPWLKVLVAPPGAPTTKPRALNIALNCARPGLLAVYDAEDQPHPGQLREAAARFAVDDPRIACLQAPLRIRTPDRPMSWIERQFALEYGVLFEIILPALARMKLPLPLGGTSNHFRIEVLKSIGGWDPWNVTEDADLGFRLHRLGYRSDVIDLPTYETPPPTFRVWLPQRTRWLKGFMQTLMVHTRRPGQLGVGGLATLLATLGASVASAALQGPFVFWIGATLLASLIAWVPPLLPPYDLSVAGYGWATAGLCMALGAARARIRTGALDILTAPAYWALLSFAQAHAVWRLFRQPHHWDKTPHAPDQ